MLSTREQDLLNKYQITQDDVDTCAAFRMGDDVMSPLYYVEDSVIGATKEERLALEAIVKRRTKQLRDFLNKTPIE